MNSASQCEVLQDRRKYPRLLLFIPVKVHIGDDLYVDALLHDVSPDGLQIRCDQETADQIHAAGNKNSFWGKPSLEIEFTLPNREKKIEIVVKCTITYFTALPERADNDVAFVLHFRRFGGDSLRLLKSFLYSEMEPAVCR